jgi:D-sedoheptulose 7-phosphate isomerase
MMKIVEDYLDRHLLTIHLVRETLLPQVVQCTEMMISALQTGNKVLIMGNGGSAADAQHFAAELVGRFRRNRQGLAAIALSTDSSAITAIGNDFGFEQIFSRQVEALAQKGDVIIGISTSGNSPNVLRGIEAAKEHGCQTVGLLGRDGGELGGMVDRPLIINVNKTPHIQEAHGIIVHLLCQIVDQAFSDN